MRRDPQVTQTPRKVTNKGVIQLSVPAGLGMRLGTSCQVKHIPAYVLLETLQPASVPFVSHMGSPQCLSCFQPLPLMSLAGELSSPCSHVQAAAIPQKPTWDPGGTTVLGKVVMAPGDV